MNGDNNVLTPAPSDANSAATGANAYDERLWSHLHTETKLSSAAPGRPSQLFRNANEPIFGKY